VRAIRIIFVEKLLFDNDVKGSLERAFKRSGIYDEYI